MTRRINNVLVIEVEPPGHCSECKEYAELRPYAPQGRCVCFPCFAKHPEWEHIAKQAMFGDAP